MSALLGLPLIGHLEHDGSVAAALVEDGPPGCAEGPVRDAAAAVLALATDGAEAAPCGSAGSGGPPEHECGGAVA